MDKIRVLVIDDELIISGFATSEATKEVLKKKTLDFIAKPFRLEDLRNIIMEATEKIKYQKILKVTFTRGK